MNTFSSQVLTVKQLMELTQMSRPQIYALTTQRKIPYYKPSGKLLYFKKDEVLEFIFSNRIEPTAGLQKENTNKENK